MTLSEIDIHELLPQQEPFVMIGRLVHFDMERTVTETDITEGNIFVENGEFTSAGIIENIAQTCAARIGYVNKYIYKKGIKIGFIGAIRNLRIERLPRVGDTLTTAIDTLEEVFGVTLVKGTVTVGDLPVAECRMKIALSDMDSQSA